MYLPVLYLLNIIHMIFSITNIIETKINNLFKFSTTKVLPIYYLYRIRYLFTKCMFCFKKCIVLLFQHGCV